MATRLYCVRAWQMPCDIHSLKFYVIAASDSVARSKVVAEMRKLDMDEPYNIEASWLDYDAAGIIL